jgi:hypothetical protein
MNSKANTRTSTLPMQVRIQIIPARMDLLPREVDTVANLLRGTLLSLIKVRLQLNYLMVHNIDTVAAACQATTAVLELPGNHFRGKRHAASNRFVLNANSFARTN